MRALSVFAVVCTTACQTPAPSTSSATSASTFLSPHTIVVPDRARLDPGDFFKAYGGQLGLGAEDTMVLVTERASQLPGRSIQLYRQTHAGVPIGDGFYHLSLREGEVRSGNGTVLRDLRVDVAPQLREVTALELARSDYRSRWKLSERATFTRESVELSIVTLDREPRLVYRCHVAAGFGEEQIDIDATDGRVVGGARERQSWIQSPASGMSTYDGIVNFTAETEGGLQWRLHGGVFVTKDGIAMNADNPNPLAAIEITSDSSYFANAGAGVSAHHFLEASRKYFNAAHAADCVQDVIHTYVQIPNWANAEWSSFENRFLFGLGDVSYASMNNVGHEYSHCILSRLGNWGNLKGEGGALNESFADIMAELIELDRNGSTDWILSPQTPVHARDLRTPSATGQPEVYLNDPLWLPTSPQTEGNDWGNIHTNLGVHNRWFTLAYLGDDNLEIPAAGKAIEKLLVTSFIDYLSTGSTYVGAADASTLVAWEQCGQYSQLMKAAHNAWHAVAVAPAPFTAPFTVPADGAEVEPWQVKLSWQFDLEFENGWVVTIAEDPTLTLNAQTIAAQDVDVINGISVGTLTVNLAPSKTYYWTVRPEDRLAAACMRPVQSFTTKSLAPTPLSPKPTTNNAKYHPWDLDFSWTPLANAVAYEVEAATAADFSSASIVAKKLLPVVTETQLDVRVDKQHYWRVRAILNAGNGETVKSDWGKTQFVTSMPVVNITAPNQGESVYPWPVDLDWDDVKGAGRYIVEIKLAKGGWADNSGDNHQIDVTAPTSKTGVNVRADEYEIIYTWRVRVLGPNIGTDATPIEEEGTPDQSTFVGAGWKTTPNTDYPHMGYCPDVNEPVDFGWENLPNATGYVVYARDVSCVQGQQCVLGDEVESPLITVPPGLVNPSVELPGFSGPFGHRDTMAYAWRVQAIGPNNMPGWKPPISSILPGNSYMVQPPPPQLVTPNGKTFDHDEALVLEWNTLLAHAGGFVISVYEGGACNGVPLGSEALQGISSQGTFNATLPASVYEEGATYSWRVRPWIYNFQNFDSCTGPQWSTCRTFDIAEEPEPIDPPYAPDYLCGQEIHTGGNLDESFIVDIGDTEGTVSIAYQTYNVSDRITVWYGGQKIIDSGCVGALNVQTAEVDGLYDWVEVKVDAQCGNNIDDTAWAFVVGCLD